MNDKKIKRKKDENQEILYLIVFFVKIISKN